MNDLKFKSESRNAASKKFFHSSNLFQSSLVKDYNMGYKVTTRSKSNPTLQDQKTVTMFEEFNQIINGKRNFSNDSPIKVNKKKPKKEKKESNMVEEIVSSIKAELQAWAIPAIVSREQQMTDCWMQNSLALVKNAKLAASVIAKNDPETGENLKKQITQKTQQPAKGSLSQFWLHPSSAPAWTTSRYLQIQPNNEIWSTWWEKIQNDYKGLDPQFKLEKYLTALDYLNHLMVNFWTGFAYNATMFTQEKIVSDITRMGDFLKLAGLDISMVDSLFKLAEDIAINKPKIGEIRNKLNLFWPTNMNIANLHYNKPKFENVVLDGPIDGVDAKATAKLKNFKFEPSVVWPDEEPEDSNLKDGSQFTYNVKNYLDEIEKAGPSGANKAIPLYKRILDELE